MGRGSETRGRILDIAQASVLEKGFGATSIDEIIAEAGITKSGFFYHFKDKNELAREMVRRYIDENEAVFDGIFTRGKELSDDPLQAFLIGLKLLAETLADAQRQHPGCLISAVCYQERLFDRDVVDLMKESTLLWNKRFRGYLDEIAAVYPPQNGMNLDDLSQSLCCMVDGGIIMSRILGDSAYLAQQVMTYRSFVRMAFSPVTSASLKLVSAA